MKKSNILLGLSASVLAVAGAFASKGKIDHQKQWGTLDTNVSPSGQCHQHSVARTRVVTVGNGSSVVAYTVTAQNHSAALTLFTINCRNTLFTIANQ